MDPVGRVVASGGSRHWSACGGSAWLVAACLAANACGGSPVSPDPRIPPAVGRPDSFMIIDWRFGDDLTTARATATWGYLYSTSRDVTSESTWESGDARVAAVVAPGGIQSVSPGVIDLTVTFRGATDSYRLYVFPGESPLPLLDDAHMTYVADTVGDADPPYSLNGIEGALIEVVAGHNMGRSTVTDRYGSYYFYPPFLCGPITVRATKAGYREAVGSSVMCMNGMPRLWMTRE